MSYMPAAYTAWKCPKASALVPYFIMQNSGSSVKAKKFRAVMFNDRDDFGVIESILKSNWLTVIADGREVEVDPSRLAKLLEKAAAQWLVEHNETLVPRDVLLQLLDGALKAEAGPHYKVYDRGGRELGLGELLDKLLPDTRLYPVSDSEYFLAPVRPLTRRDVWRLCHTLVAIARSDRREALKIYYSAFAEGGEGGDPLKWYHERLTQIYRLR